jgi:anaerobic ribonucleoside-triphosphate reductase activating protein
VSEALRVHATLRRSRANGPGTRFVVWVQGCTLACPGCFNPATHAADGAAQQTDVEALADDIAGEAAAGAIDGVTISGGEPFEQPDGLLALARALRRRAPALSILVFSGFARAEIERTPRGREVLAEIDVLVDGRYVERRRVASGLRGSANQVVHLLTSRHARPEVDATPVAEVVIGPDGEVQVTGVDPLDLPRSGG